MDTNKDIFDQIRDKSQGLKLDVKPDLWDRMEEKLDEQPLQTKKNKFFFLRIAASLVLMVGLVTIASLLLFQNKDVLTAGSNFQIEELKDNASAFQKFKQQESDRLIYRQKLQELYGNAKPKSRFN